jgi:hypothetical protein
MSAVPATFADDLSPSLSPFESVFIQTVLEHRGISNRPALAEFNAALDVLRQFTDQRQDNPPEPDRWEPSTDDETKAALRAKAFIMFGATKPSPAQWNKAHGALFGPLVCETCG